MVVVSMEDLLEVINQVNLPGTIDRHPNWRQRLPVALEEINHQEGIHLVAEIMLSAGRATLFGAERD